MPTTTNFREIEIGDGEYAAVDQNRLNAQRGTFVVSGSEITPGASSSEVTLNATATEFRADLEPYSLNEAQPAVTLSPNTTPYPRRDLVIAKVPQSDGGTASYDTIEGEPIDKTANATLVEAGIIDDDGIPIAPVMTIPEVGPPPAHGLLNEATLLAMVYIPPGTRDATDLTDDYITDLREPGSGPVDVLRPGDALGEIEGYDETVDATVVDSEAVGGASYAALRKQRPNFQATRVDIESGAAAVEMIPIPDGAVMEVWGLGISTNRGVADQGSVAARVVSATGGEGDLYDLTQDLWDPSDGDSPRTTIDGPVTVYLVANNSTGGDVERITGLLSYTIVDQ